MRRAGGLDRRSFALHGITAAAAICLPDSSKLETSPMIVVDHADALMDVPLAIELKGFAPRQPVTLAATQIFPSHSRWQAEATFVTDHEGRVAVAQQAPISGSYEGIAAMGLIWSAERVVPPSPALPDGWILQPSFIDAQAVGLNGQRAELTITRRSAGPGITRQVIRTDGLVGVLFLPPGEGPHPSVLIVHGGGGGVDETTGAMLASRGYAAFNLAYFAEPGLPRGLVNIPLGYFENRFAGCERNPGCARVFWPFGARRAAANLLYCSAPLFRISMP
jgi:Acyl-CoA thioester hydrolase/BAAT N-terminal region